MSSTDFTQYQRWIFLCVEVIVFIFSRFDFSIYFETIYDVFSLLFLSKFISSSSWWCTGTQASPWFHHLLTKWYFPSPFKLNYQFLLFTGQYFHFVFLWLTKYFPPRLIFLTILSQKFIFLDKIFCFYM